MAQAATDTLNEANMDDYSLREVEEYGIRCCPISEDVDDIEEGDLGDYHGAKDKKSFDVRPD